MHRVAAEERGDVRRPFPVLVAVLAGVATGMCVDRAWAPPLAAEWIASLLCLCGWWYGSRCAWPMPRVGLLLGAIAAASAAWHHDRWHCFSSHELALFASEIPMPVYVEGEALQRPRSVPAPPLDPLCTLPRGDQSRFLMVVDRLRDGGRLREVRGRVELVVQGHVLDVRAGDRVAVHAHLTRLVAPLNPGQVDHAALRRGDRQLCRLSADHPDCVQRISSGSSGLGRWDPRWILDTLRWRGSDMLWHYLGQRQGELASALLLGDREQLQRERTAAFFYTGTLHILAISGMHVGIVAGLFFMILRTSLLPRRAALWLVMGLTIGYAAMVDARAPVLRAAVLVVVVCLGRLGGRPAFAWNSLAAAALIVLAWNPSELFSTGAQLSFLAVATLVGLSEWVLRLQGTPDALQKLLRSVEPWPWRWVRRLGSQALTITVAGCAIWLVTLPLVMLRFHLLSPAALILNVVLWIPVVGAMFAGFIVLLTGWLCPPVAQVMGWIAGLNLWCLEATVEAVQHWPASHYWVAGPAAWWVAGYYAGLGIYACWPAARRHTRVSVAGLACWFVVGWLAPIMWDGAVGTSDEPHLCCTFLAVGHGTSVVLHTADGEAVLYDAGSLGSPDAPMQIISNYLWHAGITRLRAVIVSHADADHYNALPGLLERFPVETLYVSNMMFRHDSPALDVLAAAMRESGAAIRCLHDGDLWSLDRRSSARVLHPPRQGVRGSDNANSIVLFTECAGRSLLLPGDLEGSGLERLLSQPPQRCDVAMVPHHGSPHSAPDRFARWCQADWMMISGQPHEEMDHVRHALQATGCRVLHTAVDGAIRVRLHAQQVHVERWRTSGWQPVTSRSLHVRTKPRPLSGR